MILRLVSLVLAVVFGYGLWQTQPWAHSVWTQQALVRFAVAMCATAALTLGAHRYLFYAVVLVLACSNGVLPVLGLGFVLLGALNLGWMLFRQNDDCLNLLAGFAIYVWIFSLTASLPIHAVWLWCALLAAPIGYGRRFTLPLPQPSLPVAMPLVANFLLVLKPEVSADGLSMHFAIVQWVRDHARFHFDAANQIWSVQPMAGDWALTIAGMVGNGEFAARLLNFVWLLVIVSFVHRILRRRLDHAPAALITGIFAATPLLQLTSTSMFIENFWTAMIVGALLAVEQGNIVLAAALAGASGASKLLGLTPAPVLAGWALLKRRGASFSLRGALAPLAIFTGIVIVPYVRAYTITGNPVYHYANAFFKSPLMRSDVNFVDPRYPARLNWHTLYDVTFHTDWFVESEAGTAGYQWLWFLPLALLTTVAMRALRQSEPLPEATVSRTPLPPVAARFDGSLELAALATALFMVVLVFSRQASLRYIEAAMPLLVIAFAPAAAALSKDPVLRRLAAAVGILLLVLNLYQMPASGGYHRDFALLPFNPQERNNYITRLAPARGLIAEMNRIAPGAPVANLDGDETAGLRGPSWTATWHTQRFAGKLALVRSVADYVALMREFHVEYIIAPGEGHWRYIKESALNVFIESSTDRLATSGPLQLVKLRPNTNPPVLPPAPPGTYDDANARIIYEGPWYLDQEWAEPANRTISYTQEPNASLRFRFTGVKLTYYFTKALNRGIASIEIDGVAKGTLDLYSAQPLWQSHVAFDNLGPGTHTVVIRNVGPPKSFIDLDQLVVE